MNSPNFSVDNPYGSPSSWPFIPLAPLLIHEQPNIFPEGLSNKTSFDETANSSSPSLTPSRNLPIAPLECLKSKKQSLTKVEMIAEEKFMKMKKRKINNCLSARESRERKKLFIQKLTSDRIQLLALGAKVETNAEYYRQAYPTSALPPLANDLEEAIGDPTMANNLADQYLERIPRIIKIMIEETIGYQEQAKIEKVKLEERIKQLEEEQQKLKTFYEARIPLESPSINL